MFFPFSHILFFDHFGFDFSFILLKETIIMKANLQNCVLNENNIIYFHW